MYEDLSEGAVGKRPVCLPTSSSAAGVQRPVGPCRAVPCRGAGGSPASGQPLADPGQHPPRSALLLLSKGYVRQLPSGQGWEKHVGNHLGWKECLGE